MIEPNYQKAIKTDWILRLERTLSQNILPFWIKHLPDQINGGFIGGLTNDLSIIDDNPRSTILVTRVLWTFSEAYRHWQKTEYLQMANEAFQIVLGSLWDNANGGVYWLVDKTGFPIDTRKHSYAQAFAIYALTAYYRATANQQSLGMAQTLFRLVDQHAHDETNLGYIECNTVDWQPMKNMRLSAKEPDSEKTMNTLLHLLEAFTNLLRVWDDPLLRQRMAELLRCFFDHVIDSKQHCFKLYFNKTWQSHDDAISFGHDIEGSWLIWEAAEVLGDIHLQHLAENHSLLLADAVHQHGLAWDGSVLYEKMPDGKINADRHWWATSEGMVGFFNAWQRTKKPLFAHAAYACWRFIEDKHIDWQNGDLFKVLDGDTLLPKTDQLKIGVWECPYHHARACIEMIDRLSKND